MCPDPVGDELVTSFSAMACSVSIRAHSAGEANDLAAGMATASEVFHQVEQACTRFVADSPLMQLNAFPERSHRVPDVLFHALVEAHAAYLRTGGLFDPRIITDLVALGYDRSWPKRGGEPLTGRNPVHRPARPPWQPRFLPAKRRVDLGGHPVDLGGIGKGLAVRWAGERLREHTANFLIDAGGDCLCAGLAPDGGPWRVGVEDPLGRAGLVAALELRDLACATSSVRLRHWRAGSTRVHHLVDPRTGMPGGAGLVSVTVVGADTADAEVASKTLFLSGRERIAHVAAQTGLAALWVDVDGHVEHSYAIGDYLAWQAA
ncbi:MAG: FAD:protein FMN transferase [Mycobacteriales bacterium]